MPNVIKITGLAEVQRMLREAPPKVAFIGLGRALHAAGTEFAGAIYHACPETEEGARSGQAADGDIPHLQDELQLDVYMYADGGKAQVHFGKLDYLAAWLEFGHRRVGHKPGMKLLGFQKPDPFVRRAADESAENAIAVFVDFMDKAVGEFFGA
jgi:hypothetical protein